MPLPLACHRPSTERVSETGLFDLTDRRAIQYRFIIRRPNGEARGRPEADKTDGTTGKTMNETAPPRPRDAASLGQTNFHV